LPEEYRLAARMSLQKRVPVVFGCLVYIVLTFLYIKTEVTCFKYKRDLSSKEKKLAFLQSASIRLVQLEENRKSLEKDKALIPKVALDQPPWGEILKEIGYIIPAKTTLTALSFRTKETEKELQFEGVTFGEDSEIVRSIIEIMDGLEKSPFFSDIQLFSSREDNEYNRQEVDFEFVCRILDTG
jgi:Tfp pilus assembly protein PilN